MLRLILTSVLVLATTTGWAESNDLQDIQNGTPGRSDLVWGAKFPNSPDEGVDPVVTSVLAPLSNKKLGGFDELIPYVIPSPNQEDAGSCLYMSLTGVVEWWMARLNPAMSRAPGGPLDFSERYMMNMAGLDEETLPVKNWKVDSVLVFNHTGRTVQNDHYRFTKGWYGTDKEGDYVAAQPNGVDAEYGTPYNWIQETAKIQSGFVNLPKFEREVLFADPESNQWNVGIAPADLVDKVKQALVARKAPVHVIYNHYGYWHAVNIVGFNDQMNSEGCKFVEGMRQYMGEQPAKLRAKAAGAKDPAEKERLLKLAEKWDKTGQRLEGAYQVQGGCHPRGMFYVRDSLYEDPQGPMYDYDPSQSGDEAPYAKPIIFHEYDWVRYLVNHATQIYVQ